MNEFTCLLQLSVLNLSQGHLEEASTYLFQGIEKFETLRGFLKENDQFQISLLGKGTAPFLTSCSVSCFLPLESLKTPFTSKN